jgi:3-hydroxybutyrate dehydrogenase
VVLISSIAAQLPILPIPLYAASKAAISSFVRSMAELEPKYGIRINAVAPGLVKTPIWSEEELTWVDEKVDTWIGTERVAEVMLELIENEEYVGGTVLEVGSEVVRKVGVLNDPGAGSEKGCTVANLAKGYADTFEKIEEQFGRAD